MGHAFVVEATSTLAVEGCALADLEVLVADVAAVLRSDGHCGGDFVG